MSRPWSDPARPGSIGCANTAPTIWSTPPNFPGGWPKPRGLGRLALPVRYLRCLRRVAADVPPAGGGAARRHHLRGDGVLLDRRHAGRAAARDPDRLARGRHRGDGRSSGWRCAMWSSFNPPDALVCCGESVRKKFAPLIPAPAMVVPNGVDTERFQSDVAAPAWYRPAGCKGGDRLRRAARAPETARGRHPGGGAAGADHPGVAFVIAGEGSRRTEYEALARSLGVEHAVRFVGYIGRHAVVLRVGRHRRAAVAVGGLPERRAREHGHATRAGGIGQPGQPRGRRPTASTASFIRSVTSTR